VNSPRILIVNPFGIGDVIFSTPLVEILKKNYDGCFIGYVCNKRTYELLKTNPYIDRLYVYEKDEHVEVWKRSRIEGIKKTLGFLRTIKRDVYDISIDLSLGYKFSMILKLIGIKRRIGLNYRKRGRFLTDRIDIDGFNDKHVIEYYLDLLRPLDIDIERYYARPRIYVTEADKAWAGNFLKDNDVDDNALLVGIIPGCGASWGKDADYRRWGRDGFAKVADRLVQGKGATIIILGDRKEIPLCREMQGLMKARAVMACGKTTIGGLLGLMARCRVIVTNDGGPLHMAAGLGVSTVSIFGPVDDKVYGPQYSDSLNITVLNKAAPCRPCYKKFKYRLCEDVICLKGIKPEDVIKAAEEILDKSGKGGQT